MIYHTLACLIYAKGAGANRTIFKTEEDAIKAGYRISGACKSSFPKESGPKVVAPASTGNSNNKSSERTYIRGSCGGCYYTNSSGKKA